jgi:hypothetical protein
VPDNERSRPLDKGGPANNTATYGPAIVTHGRVRWVGRPPAMPVPHAPAAEWTAFWVALAWWANEYRRREWGWAA